MPKLPITDPTSPLHARARERWSRDDEGSQDLQELLVNELNRGAGTTVTPYGPTDWQWEELRQGNPDDMKMSGYLHMLAEPMLNAVPPSLLGRAASAVERGAGALGRAARSTPQPLALGALTAAGVAGASSEVDAADLPPGTFSVLERAIRGSKMQRQPGAGWASYLRPGRQVPVGGTTWPLRADELEHSGLFPLFNRTDPVGADELLAAMEKRTLPEVKELGRPGKIDEGYTIRPERGGYTLYDQDGQFRGFANTQEELTQATPLTPYYSSYKLPGPTSGYEESLTKWGGSGKMKDISDKDLIKLAAEDENVFDIISESNPVDELIERIARDPVARREMAEEAADMMDEPALARRLMRSEDALADYISNSYDPDDALDSLMNDPVYLRNLIGGIPELAPKLKVGATSQDFVPSAQHFASEPNLLSHSRATTRNATDGGRVRLVEELQSDWHAQGREQGYRGGPAADMKVVQNPTTGKWHVVDKDGNDIPGTSWETYRTQEAAEKAMVGDVGNRPPRAPYADSYHELELRKQLLRAVESGDDYLALTTGQQQVDRYSAGVQTKVGSIGWNKTAEGKYDLDFTDRGGNGLNITNSIGEKTSNLDAAGLRRLLGKEMTDKIISGGGSGQIKGDEISVGGTGMRLWYDEKGPAYLKKLAQQLGGEVTEVKVPDKTSLTVVQDLNNGGWALMAGARRADWFSSEQAARHALATRQEQLGTHAMPALKITPKVRAYVKQHGLPLFSAAGASLFGAKPVMEYVRGGNSGGT